MLAQSSDRIHSADLLRALVNREDGPWAEWWGKAVAAKEIKGPASRLARMLKPFDIRPKDLRIGEDIHKGYELTSFADAWSRYLPPVLEAPARLVASLKRDNATSQVSGLIAPDSEETNSAPDRGRSVVASLESLQAPEGRQQPARAAAHSTVVAASDTTPPVSSVVAGFASRCTRSAIVPAR